MDATPNRGASNELRMGGWVLLVCFAYFLAGVTALSYEVLWAKMLSLLFGVSIFGIAVTVAAFLAGLGTGSFFGTRLSQHLRRPILLLAVFEVGVALYAFNLPSILPFIETNLTGMQSASLYSFYTFHTVVSFFILFIPAFILGFGFSLAIQGTREAGVSPGVIYGVNTLGGVFGAVLPLVLLPTFGWVVGLRLTAILGFIVAVLLALAALRARASVSREVTHFEQEKIPVFSLAAYGLVGFSSLILQVAWTRLFGLLFLQTEYVLGVILATFLAGIGVGSLVARYFVAPIWLTILPIAFGVFSFSGLALLPALGGYVEHSNFASFNEALFTESFYIAVFTFPLTLILGIWYPVLASKHATLSTSPILFYSVNSIGAAVGAVLTAFVLLPTMGTIGSISFAATLFIVAALAWGNRRILSGAVALSVIGALFYHSLPELRELQPKMYADAQDKFVAEDAINITHVVEKASGERLLLADMQRMDASDEPTAVEAQKNQARLPLMFHPNPESILFLGLGTGITAAGSLPYESLHRTAVEISDGAIQAANEWFKQSNGGVSSSMNIIKDDVRRYLSFSEEKFDVIVGDLFHPDLVGRSSLLSRQQFERVSRRLNKGGVYVQWLALNQFDVSSLEVIVRTFAQVFPNSYLFVDGFRLALVATDEPISAESLRLNVQRLGDGKSQAALGGESPMTWLGRFWGKIPRTDGPVQDEWQPVIEYSLPKAKYAGEISVPSLIKNMLNKRPSVEDAAAILGVSNAELPAFTKAYLATEIWLSGMVAVMESKPEMAQKYLGMAYESNPNDRWLSLSIADLMFKSMASSPLDDAMKRARYERILNIRPDHMESLKAYWRLATEAGNNVKAEELKARILALQPGASIH